MPSKIELPNGLKVLLIGDDENNGKCAFCKQVEELRPYGPKGEWVCFDCAMKDKKAANQKFDELFD